MEMKATRDAYGHALIELGKINTNIEVLDADLAKSTRTNWFQSNFTNRFHNTGIAEANMIGIAAGLSLTGKIPFATTYSIFIGRAYDQIRQAVSYSHTNVKIVATHAGLAASYDGGSHQGLEDIAIMRVLPNMTILSPADYTQAKNAIFAAAEFVGPVYIRLGKEDVPCFTDDKKFIIGKAQTLVQGSDVAIVATGALVYMALEASKILMKSGIKCEVLNISTIKPLDTEAVIKLAKKCQCMIVAEEHNKIGGLFGAVSEFLSSNYPIFIEVVAMNDCYGESGSWYELMNKNGLSAKGIIEAVKRVYQKKLQMARR